MKRPSSGHLVREPVDEPEVQDLVATGLHNGQFCGR